MFISKYIRNQSYYVIIGNLLAAGFSMFSFIILTRTLTSIQFGEFETFMALIMLFEMIRRGLANNAIVRFINSNPDNKRKEIIGSSWAIALCLNVAFTILIYGVYYLFSEQIIKSGFELFFIYYPIFMWIVSPTNMAKSVSQARQHFKILTAINIFVPIILFVFYVVGLFNTVGLMYVIYGNIIFRFLLSIIVQFTYGSFVSHIKYASWLMIKDLMSFGKFSILSDLGANLLKSSDKILIQYFLGTASVALWSVPLKMTEVIDNPLRSSSSTSFPKMTKMYNDNNIKDLASYVQDMIAKFLLFSIPIAAICIIFPWFFIDILGGKNYENSYVILQIFAIYFILLPFDRFIGTTLSAVNKPQFDTIKVSVMAITNIIGDIVVLIIFKELWPVAIVTLLNISIGIIVGLFLVKKHVPSFSITKIFTISICKVFKLTFNNIKHKINEFSIKKSIN